MNHADDSPRSDHDGWAHVGRAAEDFARRVARDASRFAERLQEHTSDFASDVSREWRRARHRTHRRHRVPGGETAQDVRQVFEDVRGLIADVLTGIDDLIGTVFPPSPADAERVWEKVVSNCDVTCAACARPVAVGDAAYVSRGDAGVEYRCATCGDGAPARERQPDEPGEA